MMKTRFTLLALSVLFLSISSCKKDDPTLQAQLEGEWDVTSYTQDGTELMDAFIQAFTMDFGEYEGGEGDVRFTYNYTDGSSDVINGFYTVNEDNETLRVEFDGEVDRLDIDVLTDDDLELSGVIDGINNIIKADR